MASNDSFEVQYNLASRMWGTRSQSQIPFPSARTIAYLDTESRLRLVALTHEHRLRFRTPDCWTIHVPGVSASATPEMPAKRFRPAPELFDFPWLAEVKLFSGRLVLLVELPSEEIADWVVNSVGSFVLLIDGREVEFVPTSETSRNPRFRGECDWSASTLPRSVSFPMTAREAILPVRWRWHPKSATLWVRRTGLTVVRNLVRRDLELEVAFSLEDAERVPIGTTITLEDGRLCDVEAASSSGQGFWYARSRRGVPLRLRELVSGHTRLLLTAPGCEQVEVPIDPAPGWDGLPVGRVVGRLNDRVRIEPVARPQDVALERCEYLPATPAIPGLKPASPRYVVLAVSANEPCGAAVLHPDLNRGVLPSALSDSASEDRYYALFGAGTSFNLASPFGSESYGVLWSVVPLAGARWSTVRSLNILLQRSRVVSWQGLVSHCSARALDHGRILVEFSPGFTLAPHTWLAAPFGSVAIQPPGKGPPCTWRSSQAPHRFVQYRGPEYLLHGCEVLQNDALVPMRNAPAVESRIALVDSSCAGSCGPLLRLQGGGRVELVGLVSTERGAIETASDECSLVEESATDVPGIHIATFDGEVR